MVVADDFFMAERKSPQVTVTLSDKAFEELTKVADWKNIPLATLLRYIIEREHESIAFASLLERASKPEK